jgi:hypothetical protein
MLLAVPLIAGTGFIHGWFDPLDRWQYSTSSTSNPPRKLVYIPGIDGGNGSPFVQFPRLADDYQLSVQDVRFDEDANAASFELIVDDVADYLSGSGASVVMGAPTQP